MHKGKKDKQMQKNTANRLYVLCTNCRKQNNM